MGYTSRFECVILRAGAMLIFSVLFQFQLMFPKELTFQKDYNFIIMGPTCQCQILVGSYFQQRMGIRQVLTIIQKLFKKQIFKDHGKLLKFIIIAALQQKLKFAFHIEYFDSFLLTLQKFSHPLIFISNTHPSYPDSPFSLLNTNIFILPRNNYFKLSRKITQLHIFLLEILECFSQLYKFRRMSKGPNYKLCQLFGYKGQGQKVQEEDIISAIKFNNTGELLAVGDHAGRIIVFDTSKKPKKKQDIFEYYAEFQAHNKEFDCLRSQEVEQTVKDITWLNSQGKYHKLLTTNVKTIKLWKVFEKTEKRTVKTAGSDLKIPTLQKVDSSFIANIQTTFPSKHHSDIHTLSKSHNEQYLLSFDEVQGFLWNMNRPDVPYITVDYLKGKEVEDVQENLTCGKFHPSSDSMFVYTTNKKGLKLNDLRASTREEAGVSFLTEGKETKNFFTDLVSSYSSVEFVRGGKYIAARDYLTVKVWDVCQTKKPVCEVILQQNYKQKLCEMFQNQSIHDRFTLCGSSDGSQILTGNYNNNFHMIDLLDGTNAQYEVNYKKQTTVKQLIPGKSSPLMKVDYDRKTTAMDFNPKKNMFAVGSLNTFFIYSA